MLLTIDIGTTVFKSALWDFEGNRLAFSAIHLDSFPLYAMRHEADSAQWLKAFSDACTALNSGVTKNLSGVKAIVISGNGPSLTPVLGEPKLTAAGIRLEAAPARLWLDRRAEVSAKEVSSVTGAFVDQSFFLPKALAIKTYEPELYKQTRMFLGCPEFLAYSLCGEARTVFPAEGFERWFWNNKILNELNLDADKFPPFIKPMETFGSLIPSLAAHFGFSPGTPVISGGSDFIAAILGTGVIKPGQVCDRAGSSEGINACTEQRIDCPELMSYSHPVKPYWNLSGIISTTGKAIDWAKNLLGIKSHDDFFALAETAGKTGESPVFLPYLAGERAPVWNPQARAVMRNVSLSCGRAEFALAVLEGICFAIRDVISHMEKAGVKTSELRVAGTAANSGLLNRLKADICRCEIIIPEQKEAELTGLAITGSCALGLYPSISEAASNLVRIENRINPDEKKSDRYDELFGLYRESEVFIRV